MSKKIRTKSPNGRKDISLMTLLANEATEDARKLLKKYNKEDAKSFDDLEVKLANLYFQSNDKIALEKEMAEIHPHKKWILKYLQPPIEITKEEVKIEVKPEPEIKKEEKKSNADGECTNERCKCHTNPNCPMFQPFSGFSGQPETKTSNALDYAGLVAVVGVIGILFYAISKTQKG